MDSKSTVYLAIIFTFFFIGNFVPLGVLLGASPSFVVLAFFSQKFSRKVTVSVFCCLLLGNFVFGLPELASFYSISESYLASINIYGMWWYIILQIVLGYSIGRVLNYRVARLIIKRNKLWQRYPL
jgi:sterol desaturase/sphingolipid hydroxylase (fatty acid hydroxylase superfamily)